MTLKVYSVKSNARRDARKLGLDPLSVIACPGGFIIGALQAQTDVVEQKGKKARLLAMLRDDWQPMPTLERHLGWLPHTVRGALSSVAKPTGVKVERQRIDGVTSYRVARPS